MKENFNACPVSSHCDCIIRALEKNKVLAKENEELLRALDSITDGLYIIDENWNLIYVNKSMEQLSGQDRRTVIGKSIWDFTPKTNLFYEALKKVKKSKQPIQFEGYSEYFKRWMRRAFFRLVITGLLFIY